MLQRIVDIFEAPPPATTLWVSSSFPRERFTATSPVVFPHVSKMEGKAAAAAAAGRSPTPAPSDAPFCVISPPYSIGVGGIKYQPLDLSYIKDEEKKNLFYELAVKDYLEAPFIVHGPGIWHKQKLKRYSCGSLQSLLERLKNEASEIEHDVDVTLDNLIIRRARAGRGFQLGSFNFFQMEFNVVDRAVRRTYLAMLIDCIESELLQSAVPMTPSRSGCGC